jgi:hypothetical protein
MPRVGLRGDVAGPHEFLDASYELNLRHGLTLFLVWEPGRRRH